MPTFSGLTNDELLSNSVTFMVAGYDTTATTLLWLVYDLMLNPEAQDKLFDEIDQEIGQVLSAKNIIKALKALEAWAS